MLILKTFNPVFWAVVVLAAVILYLTIQILKNKSKEEKEKAVFCIYLGIFGIYLFYKVMILFFDPGYSQMRLELNLGGTSIWKELPINPCNVCLILLPLGLKLKKRAIVSMCYFISLLGAFFALIMPDPGFSGYSILIPRVLCFYICHMAILFMPFLLSGLDVYQPEYRDILKADGLFYLLILFDHIVNTILRITELEVHANYLYTYEPRSIMNLLYNLIPVPGLYMLPGMVLVALYMAIITFIARISVKKDNLNK